MAFPTDPLDPLNSAVDRIRITLGDTDPDEVLIETTLYEYLLTSSNDNEPQATLKAVNYLVSRYAGYMDEDVGEVEIKFSKLYWQYKDLANKLSNDPRYSVLKAPIGYMGGISNQEQCDNEADLDNILNPFTQGWVTKKNTRRLR